MAEVKVEQIDVTQETGDPVFEAQSSRARMSFLFPSTNEHDIIVHTVFSEKAGGMSELLDYVCRKYDCELIRFSTPLGPALEEKLDGFERVVETIDDGPLAGEPWECLDGRWVIDDA